MMKTPATTAGDSWNNLNRGLPTRRRTPAMAPGIISQLLTAALALAHSAARNSFRELTIHIYG
jgi:hypothetical protein